MIHNQFVALEAAERLREAAKRDLETLQCVLDQGAMENGGLVQQRMRETRAAIAAYGAAQGTKPQPQGESQ